MQITKNKAVKRNQISLETKLEIIEKHQNGKTPTELANKYKLAQSTISTIISNKDKLNERFQQQKLDKIYRVLDNFVMKIPICCFF